MDIVDLEPGTAGHERRGQRRALVVSHEAFRAIDLACVSSFEIGGRTQVITNPAIRKGVRAPLARQLGLDVSAAADGSA